MYLIEYQIFGLTAYLYEEVPGSIDWVFTPNAATKFNELNSKDIVRTLRSSESYKTGYLKVIEYQNFMYLVLDADWKPVYLTESKHKAYYFGKKLNKAKIQKAFLDDESMQLSEIVYEFNE